jgi:hypothetical protein
MKRIIIATLLLTISLGLNAQKLRNSDIPQEVRLGLENTYSDYKLQGWYFETGQYVAEISIDDQIGRVFLTVTGNWQFTIFNVAEQELPTLVANYFLNNYPGYRIKKSEYIEDFSGDNYYRLIIAMKGLGQTEYEMIFDPRGKLTKTNAPDPDFVKKDYISRLNPEAIEYRQRKMAERAEMDGSGLEIRIEDDVKSAGKKKSKDVEIDMPETLETASTPKEVLDAFKKKFPRIEVEEWKQEGENFRAYCENRGVKMELLYKPDGMLMTTTKEMQEERYPRQIMKDLAERYPNAKIEKFQKVEYDMKYRRTVTDRVLDAYFYLELTEKIKGKKDKKYIKLTYDKSFRYQGLAGSTDEYED